MKQVLLLAATLTFAACGTEGDFECSIGELAGTWRMSYIEIDGNCGPIADETVNLSSAAAGGASDCVTYAESISADKCTFEIDQECPFLDIGTQRWTSVWHQVEPERLEGTSTVQVDSTEGVCRSTYEVTIKKL